MLDSRILAVLSLLVTVLSAIGGGLQVISPDYAIWIVAASGALSAFLAKIQEPRAKIK